MWAASELWVTKINSQLDSADVNTLYKPDGVGFLLCRSGILRPFHDSVAVDYDYNPFYRFAAHKAFRVSFNDLLGFQGRAGSTVIDSWKDGRCTCSN